MVQWRYAKTFATAVLFDFDRLDRVLRRSRVRRTALNFKRLGRIAHAPFNPSTDRQFFIYPNAFPVKDMKREKTAVPRLCVRFKNRVQAFSFFFFSPSSHFSALEEFV